MPVKGLVFAILSLVLAARTGAALRWVYAALMLANAAVLAWVGTQIAGGRKGIFFLAVIYMAINVVLTITDQFGLIDALVLFLNLALLGLLFITRQRLKQAES